MNAYTHKQLRNNLKQKLHQCLRIELAVNHSRFVRHRVHQSLVEYILLLRLLHHQLLLPLFYPPLLCSVHQHPLLLSPFIPILIVVLFFQKFCIQLAILAGNNDTENCSFQTRTSVPIC